MKSTKLRRLCLLWAVSVLITASLGGFTACQPSGVTPSDSSTGDTHTVGADTDRTDTAEAGILTLPAVTEPAEPFDPNDSATWPTADDLDADTDYTALLITSFYTTGHVAGKARVEASYVELYNRGDSPVSLEGVSLYVSDRGGAFTEYRFPYGATLPAKGHFLVRGRDAGGTHEDALTLTYVDCIFPTLCPDASDTRLVLAAAERTLPVDSPLCEVDGLFAYVSASERDGKDTNHYAGHISADKVVRKKANTDMVDYQTINLTRASATVLVQIRPQTTAGDVNTAVNTLIDEVVFSHESGVYEGGFDLELTAPEGYTVYFSINDTDPRLGVSNEYRSPLHLSDTTAMTWGTLTAWCATNMGKPYTPNTATLPGAAVIKAFAVRKSDGAVTPLTTHTYLIGQAYADWNVDIVSLSLQSDRFLGVDGIYNTLRTDADGGHSHIPAYVEFIDPDGHAVHMGWSEIAMNGRGSLGMSQKSIRILLKSAVMDTDVDENLNTLNYDLYGEYASTTPTGERLTWYRHILLRNGGGDMSGSPISRSHIGDAYVQRLDRYLTPDVMAYAPAMLFVNGEFFGLFNARDRLDPSYFACKYGIPEEDFALLECPYPLTFGWNVDFTAANGDPSEATYFMNLVNFCVSNDMTVPDNYNYIASRIDLDGLIDQYCAQIYLCCSDWPSNNIKVWRNTNASNPYIDTRWHFTIVDTDHGVGLNSSVETNLFGVINDGPVLSRIVNHMLTNQDFRERFYMRFIWCAEVYFDAGWMKSELDTLVGRITPVMQYQLDRWRCTNGDVTDWNDWYHYIEVIRDFAERRPAYAKQQFMSWAGISETTYRRLLERAIAEWGEHPANVA